jgi:hypothetical protein
MFRLRFTSDCHARTNGQAPQSTTGVSEAELDPDDASRALSR